MFDSREDVLRWAWSLAHENEFVAVIIRFDTNTGSRGRTLFVLIGCERNDEYRCRKKEFVRRDIETRKCGCRFKLKRFVAILNYVLVQLQLAVTEGSITESKHWTSHYHSRERIINRNEKETESERNGSTKKCVMCANQMSLIAPDWETNESKTLASSARWEVAGAMAQQQKRGAQIRENVCVVSAFGVSTRSRPKRNLRVENGVAERG